MISFRPAEDLVLCTSNTEEDYNKLAAFRTSSAVISTLPFIINTK